MLGPRFTAALASASELHGDQVRKGTDIPYVSHLLAVSSLVLENGGDEDQAIAALLHDSIEDQREFMTLKRIRARFGDRVAEMVNACTDVDDYPEPPWLERKEEYVSSVKHKSDDAMLISLCDKVHNARAILWDYKYVGEKLWDRFKGKRDGTLWYYRALVEAFRSRGFARLFEEFESTVSQIEGMAADASKKHPKSKSLKKSH
jgi:(p)ppGpp synthase/HD superfamily hydrolase